MRIAIWVSAGIWSLSAWGSAEVYERDRFPDRLGLRPYLERSGVAERLARLKIAVLDNGFGGFEASWVGSVLPPGTRLVSSYPREWVERRGLSPEIQGNPLTQDRHGLSMAQIAWAATGNSTLGPRFYLLNANGFTQFRRAIQYAIDERVDVILYGQNWEFGGNFDGQGFINAEVTRATSAGILWVNAAGNYGGQVFDDRLPPPDRELRFTNRFDENPVRFVVSWSDFRNVESHQTNLDLDVEVLDSVGRVVAQGNRTQVPVPGLERGESSLHARELFSATLARGDYRIRLLRRAGRFSAETRVRVLIQPERPETGIEFSDRTREREIMIPADHSEVLTVGDLSEQSARGPTIDGRAKPDLFLDFSEVRFTNGLRTSGTSNAAALFAGIALVLKADRPELGRSNLLAMRRSVEECLRPTDSARISETVWQMLETFSGVPRSALPFGVARDGRLTVLTPREPAYLGALFGEQRAYIERRHQPIQAFQFFLSQTGERIFTMRTASGVPTLPADLLPGGERRWVELVSARRGLAVCSQVHERLWVTPAPH